jgi:type II secretory pathway component PulJ
MNRQSGFTAIELLIYITLCAGLAITVFGFVARAAQDCLQSQKTTNELVEVALAQELLARDMRRAPIQKIAWKKISNHELIWNSENGDIGWLASDNGMFRTTGTYDTQSDQWLHKRKISCAKFLHRATFSVGEKNHRITHITTTWKFSINGVVNESKETVFLRNRVV